MIKFCSTCKGTRTVHQRNSALVTTHGPCPDCKDTTFGERLKLLMLDRKLRVREIAYKTDAADSTINGYIMDRKFPSYRALVKIIKLLNPSDKELIWLMRGELRDE